jgi:hypothetical protein
MTEHPEAMPHGPIAEIFPDVFFVTGTMRGEFFGSVWQFSRNMTIVRDEGKLSLINAVRLDDAGLAALEQLGEVRNVIRLGSMHGRDDAFYVERFRALYWGLNGAPDTGTPIDKQLVEGGELPFPDGSVFVFTTTKLPEAIIRLARSGGIMLACDALQNWVAPDEFFSDTTAETMRGMGFFTPANLGPAWQQFNEPGRDDFVRLAEIPFSHALCGHGEPLRDHAQARYRETFKRLFDV